VVGGLIAGILLIELLTESVVPLLILGALLLGIGILMLDDSTGAITNNASILAGRPVAVTARGRKQITVHHITPEIRRERWLLFLIVLALWAFVAVFAIVHG
jgi:hypothetical protein